MAEGGGILRQLLVEFGVEVDADDLPKVGGILDTLGSKAKEFGAALAGGAVVGVLSHFVGQAIEAGDELGDTAERLGLTAQELQELRFVADQVDVSAEELGASLRVLTKNAAEAASGGGEAAAALQSLGVSARGADGGARPILELLPEIAQGFSEVSNATEKGALAQKIFGRGGLALVPLLNRGAKGVDELRKKFVALGGGLSTEAIEAAGEADVAFKDLRFATSSLTNGLAAGLIPAVTWGVEKITAFLAGFRQLAQGTNLVKAGIATLVALLLTSAAPILVAYAPMIASFLLWAAVIGAVILVVDDLITWFRGGKSVIGDFIDSIWGVGTSAKVVETLKSVFSTTWEVIKTVGAALRWAFFEVGNWIGDTLIPTLVTTYEKIVAVATAIRDAFGAAFDWVSQKWDAMVGGITKGLNWFKENVVKPFDSGAAKAFAPGGGEAGGGGSSGFASAAASVPVAGNAVQQNNNVSVTVNASTNASAPEIASAVREQMSAVHRQTLAALDTGG